MNKIIRGLVVIPTGFIKTLTLKIFHPRSFKGVHFDQISPFSEITIERGAKVFFGKGLKIRDGVKIRVRKGAALSIGDNVSIGSNSIITCRDKISISDGTEISPNVFIYDHDHDFREKKGIKAGFFRLSPIQIGKNVWIGCNSVVLRGVCIGDESVIAAGSVISKCVPERSVFIQKRNDVVKENKI